MKQTKPLFLIRKYRSILRATLIVEAVNYIVSLTDSIVAGNLIGGTALAAIGLIAPFMTISVFAASIIESGTIKNYSYHIGCFDEKRAREFFSQGLFLAVLTGVLYAGLLFVLRDFIVTRLTTDVEMQQYAREYFTIILLMFLLNPLANLLDNMTVADGGEKLSAAANVVFIISNVLLSFLFARFWGVRGIAVASVVSNVLFIALISLHLLGKTNTLRLLRHWSNRDGMTILRSGIVMASTYALDALTVFAVNLFVSRFFDSNTLILLVMVEQFMGLLAVFIGMSMAAQPLIGTLNGERNNKALRALMKTVSASLVTAGLLLTGLTLLFTPYLVRAFGIAEQPLLSQGVIALRIVSATLVLHAILALFFVYYYLMDRQKLAFALCVFKNVISPLLLAVLLSVITGKQIGMWIGLAAAPVLSVLSYGLVIYLRCVKSRREGFPLLLPEGGDEHTYIYDFDITTENAVDMARTADGTLDRYAVTKRTRVLASLFVEEMLMLILEKNPDTKVSAECTIIVEPTGIRLILRDSGKIFDITDEDSLVDSFRQYVISNLMVAHDSKAYLTTTGYNRNELFFPENVSGV